MDRELVLAVLALVLTGATVQLASFWPTSGAGMTSAGREAERRSWSQLWAPLAPGLVVLCALAGWAAVEPEPSEQPPRSLIALTVPFAFICARAGWRAAKALARRRHVHAAAAVGLFRPRVVVSDRFRGMLDDRAVDAALAHEAAHVRHRDPLRVWLAQLATDLQWPSRRAAARFRTWMRVLEFARDDEARRGGADGADLAAAILAAVRWQAADRVGLAQAGEAVDLEARIRRLLASLPPNHPNRSNQCALAFVAAPMLVAVTVAGAWFGETIVRTVFSALP